MAEVSERNENNKFDTSAAKTRKIPRNNNNNILRNLVTEKTACALTQHAAIYCC